MPIKVWLDTSPLQQGHAIRGIGQYTRQLASALSIHPEVELLDDSTIHTQTQADIVHYPYFDIFAPTLPWNLKAPTVVTIHDVIPLKFPKFYQPGLKGTLHYWRQRLALGNVSAVITDSRSSWSDIHQHLGIPERKIAVTHLGVNPELSKPSQTDIEQVLRKHRLPKKYVLYVGDINYNKNIPQLIKAFKYLPYDVYLVCLGKNFFPQDIPEWRWIEAQTAMSNVGKRVKFITDLAANQSNDLAAIYAGAQVYVQPSLYEGFGLPIVEAMRCRVPVICSHNSSLIEVGGNHVVFSEPVAEAFASHISEVLEWSKTRREDWVRAADQWSQQYTWAATAQKTVGIYQKVLAREMA